LTHVNPLPIDQANSGRVITGRAMTKITYIEHNGTECTVDVPNGLSVMEGAVKFRIPEIDGDCGGACACATCHVYVAPEWLERLPPMQELERNMLKFANTPNETSRLSCQIKVAPELDGLTVTTPVSQY
jgi:2Fe-2S ferredoxin